VFSSFVTPYSGIIRAMTLFSPSASIAILSVSAESTPPESPRTAFLYPASVKYFLSWLTKRLYVFCGFFITVWLGGQVINSPELFLKLLC